MRGAIPNASWQRLLKRIKSKHIFSNFWVELVTCVLLLTLYLLSIPLRSCGSFHVTTIASLTSLAVTSLGWLGTKTNGMIQRQTMNLPLDIITRKGLNRRMEAPRMSDPEGKSMSACLHDYSSKLYFNWYHCYSIFFKNSNWSIKGDTDIC